MDIDVLIAGAGPTGLTLAAQLARSGVSFRILDKGRGPTDLSKAIGVQARTLEILDILGDAETLVSRGNQARHFNIYDGADRILKLDFPGLDSRFPFLLVVPQSETEKALMQTLDWYGVSVERNTALSALVQDASGVWATVSGPDGKEEQIRARWVAGCDGAHSTVRHLLSMPFTGEEYLDGFMLADVRVSWNRPQDELYLFLHEGRLIAFFAFPDGRYRIIADLPPDQASPESAPALADCQRLVDERVPFPAQLSDPEWTAYYRIHRRIVPRLQEGRVFLAGDAAHIHSPAGAQGMNTGIQDAFNLGWKLALVAQGCAGDSLLASYHEERYPVERAVLQGTDFLLKMASLKTPALRSLRDHALPLISSTRAFQTIAAERISEISVDYHDSLCLTDRDYTKGLRPGERAPDGELEREDGSRIRLYQLLREGKFLLLAFADIEDDLDYELLTALDEIPPALSELTIIVIITRHTRSGMPHAQASADPDGQPYKICRDLPGDVFEKYGATHPCVRIVRPDGYLGFRSDARNFPAAISEYATKGLCLR